jgi:hypothetical protein
LGFVDNGFFSVQWRSVNQGRNSGGCASLMVPGLPIGKQPFVWRCREFSNAGQLGGSDQRQQGQGTWSPFFEHWQNWKKQSPLGVEFHEVLLHCQQQANKLDVPCQSLMRVWLTEKLREGNGQAQKP